MWPQIFLVSAFPMIDSPDVRARFQADNCWLYTNVETVDRKYRLQYGSALCEHGGYLCYGAYLSEDDGAS